MAIFDNHTANFRGVRIIAFTGEAKNYTKTVIFYFFSWGLKLGLKAGMQLHSIYFMKKNRTVFWIYL